jgi:hypothetical protein
MPMYSLAITVFRCPSTKYLFALGRFPRTDKSIGNDKGKYTMSYYHIHLEADKRPTQYARDVEFGFIFEFHIYDTMGISYIRSFCIVLGMLTTEEFAAGIILVVALIAAFVFSILWNKGILPRTMYVARSSPFHLRILARVE